MKKIIVITGVLLTTSCGMFSKMTEQEKELNYQIPSYDEMLKELIILINKNKILYKQYLGN